jgi:hypothetical protein
MVPGTLLRAYYRRRPGHGVGPEEGTYLAERRRSRRRRRRSRAAALARTCRTWGTAPPESARPPPPPPRPLPFPAGSDLAGQHTPWRPRPSQQAPPRHEPTKNRQLDQESPGSPPRLCPDSRALAEPVKGQPVPMPDSCILQRIPMPPTGHLALLGL